MADVKKIATRVSYGEALVELANEHDDFVVLDADLAAATQTGKFKAACPDRFFDVNEGRGWRTNSGKPVDDWKKLAAVWDRNEHPKAATPPARTEPKADAVVKIPSVEEVMAKWGCDRETAQGYIDEDMY
mgnify:CR=1 FL=1